MVRSNLHTHSLFSDGKCTVDALCDTAIEKGFLSLGISDHSYTAFDDTFCMKKDRFDDYVAAVTSLKEVYKDRLTLFLGMELDYYAEGIDCSRLDYTIGSVHYVKKNGVYYPVDHAAESEKQGIDEGFGGDRIAYATAYFENLCDNIRKNACEIVGHFDVLAKFGLFDEDDPRYRRLCCDAADYLIEKGAIIEINTGAVAKKLRTVPYPAPFILKHILEKGGRVCIDADAHIKENLDFYFAESAALLKEIGFRTAVMLTDRGFEDYEL